MKRLRWIDLISINLFWLGLNIRNNAVGVIFTPYLVDKFVGAEVKNTALGAIRTAGLVIAMLMQPAAGLLSDRSTARWGRRRPFILAGVLMDLLCLTLIAFSWDYGSLLVATLLMQFSANISHGAVQGLIPDLVPESQRGLASGVKAIMELIPLILMAFTVAMLVGLGLFRWGVAAAGAMLLMCMVLTVLLVKEQPLQAKPEGSIAAPMMRVLGMLAGVVAGMGAGLVGGGAVGGLAWLVARSLGGAQIAWAVGVSLGGMVAMASAVVVGVWAGTRATLGREVYSRKPFAWWVVNRLMFFAAITSIQAFAPYFLMYAFGVSSEQAAQMTGNLMMVVGIFTLLSALPSGWLSDRLGHRRLVAISGGAAAVGAFLLLGTVWMPNMAMIYVAGCVLGAAAGLFTTTNWALGCELVAPAEAGHYLGVSNLAGAGAGMIGTGIGGPMADQLNQVRPGLGYLVIFACYGVLFLLSVGSLRGVREPQQAAITNAA